MLVAHQTLLDCLLRRLIDGSDADFRYGSVFAHMLMCMRASPTGVEGKVGIGSHLAVTLAVSSVLDVAGRDACAFAGRVRVLTVRC